MDDDVLGALRVVRHDRYPAGERLEHHAAEGVEPGWEHQQIRGRVHFGQFGVVDPAEEDALRHRGPELLLARPTPRDRDLHAGDPAPELLVELRQLHDSFLVADPAREEDDRFVVFQAEYLLLRGAARGESLVRPVRRLKYFRRRESHGASREPLSLVGVEHKQAVERAVKRPEEAAHPREIVRVEIQDRPGEHHPVGVRVEVRRHGVCLFEVEGQHAHRALGRTDDPVVFAIPERPVYIKDVGQPYGLLFVKRRRVFRCRRDDDQVIARLQFGAAHQEVDREVVFSDLGEHRFQHHRDAVAVIKRIGHPEHALRVGQVVDLFGKRPEQRARLVEHIGAREVRSEDHRGSQEGERQPVQEPVEVEGAPPGLCAFAPAPEQRANVARQLDLLYQA